jgi:hypothetical protein
MDPVDVMGPEGLRQQERLAFDGLWDEVWILRTSLLR